jgi:flagellar biosynthesis protein
MPAPDPRQSAIALAYDGGDGAPRVAAKGRGLVAEAIIARAREAGIYVHESPQLVALLMQVDLDAHIPQELYLAVAELLAWLYRLEHAGDASAGAIGEALRAKHA